jgi:plasmid maintenance system antidote protein VapI
MVTRNSPKNSGKTLTKQLRTAIKQSKLSIRGLARGAGIPQQRLQQFMADENNDIRLGTANKLAKFFGMQLTPAKYAKVKR